MKPGLSLLIGMFFPDVHGDSCRGHTQHIRIDAEPPQIPEHQQVYDVLTQRQWLEMIQEIYDVFKLPTDITIRTRSCDGVSNAWYIQGTVTICYEYLEGIRKDMPQVTTLKGLTPTDAVVGQYVYTVSHELGHALFDVLDIPLLGRPEDAADQFAAYMMLQLDKEQAYRLLGGAAYSYKNYIRNQQVAARWNIRKSTLPLVSL
jgi:hypothetical protein